MRGNKHSLTKKNYRGGDNYENKSKVIPKKFEKESNSDTEEIFENSKNSISTNEKIGKEFNSDTEEIFEDSKKSDQYDELKNKYEQSCMQIEYLQELVNKLTTQQYNELNGRINDLLRRLEKMEATLFGGTVKNEISEQPPVKVDEQKIDNSKIEAPKIPLPGNKTKK